MYSLDIITGEMPQFKRGQKAMAMAAFNSQAVECALYERDECIAEKYHIQDDDGNIILESVIYEPDAEYVSL